MITTITTKGQVTLPKAVRDQLRLGPGDKLDFFVTREGHIQAIPVREPATKLKGILPRSAGKKVTLADMERGIVKGATGK